MSAHTGQGLAVAILAAGILIAGAAGSQEVGAGADRMLEDTAVESGYAEVEGGTIFYEVAGEGENMVFIHDGLLHREVWDGQFPFFAGRYRVIRYDRRGYGGSPQPEESFSDLEDLHQIFDQLQIDTAIVVGMSAGGRLAIDFALAYPDRVSGLVLVGAVLSGYTYSEHFYTRGGRLDLSDYADTQKMSAYWVEDDPYEIAAGNEAARARARDLLAANPQNFGRQKFTLARQPDRPALGNLHEIAVPTLLVIGEHDIPDVHAHGGAIESSIEGAQRIIVSGAAHLVPLERPADFNTQVGLFLSESTFLAILESKGIAAAMDALKEAKMRDPDIMLFREAMINLMGYQALQAGDIDGAMGLFRLNVEAFPQSWNVYDSLAEAYAEKGETDLAIANYERSLELNPENANARAWIERLRSE